MVIPVFDERDTLEPLYDQICVALTPLGKPFELLMIDDGSADGSFDVMKSLHERDSRVRVFRFWVNRGKSPALAAGFDHARGDVIFTMDADLQDDPAELPSLLAKLDEGYDLVSGWKRNRKDPLSKKLFSKLFNATVSSMTGIHLHDFNCGLKAYRREVIKKVMIYGEMHRYIPVLAAHFGFRIAETPVTHHPRRSGRSKFGAERIFSGLLDFATVIVLTRFVQNPSHLFGKYGILFSALGSLLILVGVILGFFVHSVAGLWSLGIGGIAFLLGVHSILLGLFAEIITYYRRRDERPYYINERLDD